MCAELIHGRHVHHLVIRLILLDYMMVRGQHDKTHEIEETHQIGYKQKEKIK